MRRKKRSRRCLLNVTILKVRIANRYVFYVLKGLQKQHAFLLVQVECSDVEEEQVFVFDSLATLQPIFIRACIYHFPLYSNKYMVLNHH
jgi:hypothetical protein